MSDPAAGSDGSLPPEWQAPEDARELAGDARALHSERAVVWRRTPRGPLPARWWRAGTPGLVVGLILLGVAAVAVTLIVGSPVGLPTESAARPLATPTALPGSAAGLLPEVTVAVGDQERPARTLRPAVLALLPEPCECAAALRELAVEAGQYAVPLILITRGGNAEVPALLRAAARSTRAYPALDARAALARAYAARGLTILLVRDDGVVTSVARQHGPGLPFGAALADLTTP